VKSTGHFHIELLPLGVRIEVPPGTALHEVLSAHGVEFPCGAQGQCNGCRIRVLNGNLPPTDDDLARFSPDEIHQGWRLACRAHAGADLQIELAQWEVPILADDSRFPFTPQPGLGIAVDLGTTTIVAQLLDLSSGRVLGVRTALNRQAQYGSDVMSRIQFASQPGEQGSLTRLIRRQLGDLIAELLGSIHSLSCMPEQVVIVGNTLMHHLFGGLDVEPLGHSPFAPVTLDLQTFTAESLSWKLPGDATVRFLPALGGFVGSDLLAGILATQLHESEQLIALIDLGTNGEIILGNRHGILCASTAAGPAFEGAGISHGMRAAAGAISAVQILDHHLHCHVLGQVEPRGICGSGLVDAVSAGLTLGHISPSGRLLQGRALPLLPPIDLTQSDIRQLQLAKAAIAAGLKLLLRQWGAQPEDLAGIFLAGAFGNYINRTSAHSIGLLPLPPDRVHPAGNTALLGAKIALFNLSQSDAGYSWLRNRVHHVSLNENSRFEETFINELAFPSHPLSPPPSRNRLSQTPPHPSGAVC
jgi:uncharacterized 2Fe-2S/4Fe-4S cluster protein (DUF4445 family)